MTQKDHVIRHTAKGGDIAGFITIKLVSDTSMAPIGLLAVSTPRAWLGANKCCRKLGEIRRRTSGHNNVNLSALVPFSPKNRSKKPERFVASSCAYHSPRLLAL